MRSSGLLRQNRFWWLSDGHRYVLDRGAVVENPLDSNRVQLCVCKPYHGVGAVESAIKIESRVISVRVGSHSRVLKKAARRRAIIMRKRLSENWLPCGKESSRWRHY
jgi:hypothetical protein